MAAKLRQPAEKLTPVVDPAGFTPRAPLKVTVAA
jgi:hypothetical protein